MKRRRRAGACRWAAPSSTPSSGSRKSTTRSSTRPTTWKSSAPISEEDLDHIERSVRAAGESGCGVAATFGGTAFGDIALVPAPFLKIPERHPRRRGVVHVHAHAARLHPPHLRAPVRNRHREPGAHPCPHRRRRGLRVSSAARISARRLRRSAPSPPSASCGSPTTSASTTGCTPIPPGNVSNIPAAAWSGSSRASSRPGSTSSTRCSVRRRAWSRPR